MAILVSIYIAIWFLQVGNRISLLGTIRIEFILGLFLTVASLHKLLTSADSNPAARKLIVSVFVFYFFLLFFAFVSYDQAHSWNVFFERVLKFSLLALFISAWARTKADFVIIVFGFFIAIFKIAQEGYFGIFTGGMMWQNQGIMRLHGVTPLFRHPNSLSGLAVSALPFFVFLFKFQTWHTKIAFLIGGMGLLLIVLYTGSRTGYLATFVIFLCMVYRMGILRAKTLFYLTVIALAAVVFTPEEYKDRLMTIFQSEEERGGSANKRLEIIEDAFVIVGKYPLGIGVQAFPHIRDLEFGRAQDTHNLYLEVMTNLGIPGFIAFLCFIYYLFKLNLDSNRKFKLGNELFLSELCIVINLYILCRLALGMFGMDLYEIYWWFAIGFTVALSRAAAKIKTGS